VTKKFVQRPIWKGAQIGHPPHLSADAYGILSAETYGISPVFKDRNYQSRNLSENLIPYCVVIRNNEGSIPSIERDYIAKLILMCGGGVDMDESNILNRVD